MVSWGMMMSSREGMILRGPLQGNDDQDEAVWCEEEEVSSFGSVMMASSDATFICCSRSDFAVACGDVDNEVSIRLYVSEALLQTHHGKLRESEAGMEQSQCNGSNQDHPGERDVLVSKGAFQCQ